MKPHRWFTSVIFAVAFGGIAAGQEGDFDGDGELAEADVEILMDAIKNRSDDPKFDVEKRFGPLNHEDLVFWVHELKGSWIGDANFDGEFNTSDFIQVFQFGKYETGEAAVWSDGDWSADDLFNSGDLVTAFASGGFERGPRKSVSVPEPDRRLAIGLIFGLAGVRHFRRRIDAVGSHSQL